MSCATLKAAKNSLGITLNEFSKSMECLFQRAPETIKSMGTGKIAVAISGGPDSLALASLLRKLYPKERLVGIFIDHNLRCHNVTESEEKVQQIFKVLDIEGYTKKINWDQQELSSLTKGQMQEKLRDYRYRLLLEACIESGSKIVMTGHNLDDDVTIMLYRMSHGSGVDGMAGMKWIAPFPVLHQMSDKIFVGHPLIEYTKERLVSTCVEANLDWNLDKSNEDTGYQHNGLLMGLSKMQEKGIASTEELSEMLRLFKDFRFDVQNKVNSAFKKSIILNTTNGDGTVVLNDEKWLNSPAVFTRIVGILTQYSASRRKPSKTQRLNELHRALLKTFYSFQEEQKKLRSNLPSFLQKQEPQAFDLTRRINMGQSVVGGATFLPLSRSDALRRINLASKLLKRNIQPGPCFLVQREPPTRIDSQAAGFGAKEAILTPNTFFLWDDRIYLKFSDPTGNLEPRKFSISFMTVADVREFEKVTPSNARRFIYSFMGITPGTHFYQIPVVREVGTNYIAFPTLKTQFPPDKYHWITEYAGSYVLTSRFNCRS